MPVQLKTGRRARKIGAELIRRHAVLPVADVSDSLSVPSAAGARLRPVHDDVLFHHANIRTGRPAASAADETVRMLGCEVVA